MIPTACSCSLLFCLLWLAILPQGVQAQRVGQAIGVDSVLLDTDATASKMLGAARDLLSARQWGDAIDLVRQIGEQHGERLVAITPGRFISVHSYCDLLLSSLPDEGLKLYRSRTDPQARRWFETAQAARDAEGLRKLVKRAFLSSYGDDALLLLGQLAWEQGDLSQARSWWEQLLPLEQAPAPGQLPPVLRYPGGAIDPALIRARLVFCSLLQGELSRATRELTAFRELYPQATGRLAGRVGNLVEALEAQAALARKESPVAESSHVHTFAGNPQRNDTLAEAVDVGSIQWTAPLSTIRIERNERGGPPQDVLSYYPVVSGNVVYYADETSVFARELLSAKGGRPPWGGEAFLHRIPAEPGAADRAARRVGYPRFTVSIDRGRLYAQLGTSGSRSRRPGLPGPASIIVCLDLNRQGDMLWKKSVNDIDGEKGAWSFDGAPLAAGGRVYVALRRTDPQLQLNIACFGAESGNLLWNRKVCLGLEAFGPEVDEIHHQLLTLDDRRLYCCTNLGAVAALDAEDGSLRWVARYPRADIESIAAFNHRQSHGPNPCVCRDGRVFAAPTDSDHVLAYDAETGIVLWDRELKGNAHQLVGAEDGKLVVAGDLLWGLDSDSGNVKWFAGRADPEAATRGRSTIGGGFVYWPRREEILMVEVATGRIHREIALVRQHSIPGGGNVTLADGCLILAQADKLVTFSEFGSMRKQRQNQVTRRPRDPRAQFELGLVAEAMNDFDAALAAYAQARESSRRDDLRDGRSIKELAAQRQARLSIELGTEAKAAADWTLALERFGAAAAIDEAPREALEARIALARMHEERGELADAVVEWQRVWDAASRPPGALEAIDSPPEGRLARAEIDRLIARHGRSVYAAVERDAERALADALRLRDIQETSALIARYPHALATDRGAQRLAALQREADDLYGADRTYQEILAGSRRDSAGPQALAGLARNAEIRKYRRSAMHWWQELYDRHAGAEIDVDGLRRPVAELAAESLNRLRPAPLDRGASEVMPLLRRWERLLPGGSLVLVPEGRAPDDAWDCVLLAAVTTSCWNTSDGRERWQLALPEPPQWAGFVADLLVLGSATAVTGVAPDDGRILWHQFLGSDALRTARADRSFRIAGERLFCRVGESEVWALHPETGTVAWRYRAPHGTLQPAWLCGTDRLVVQLFRPDRWQVLDARDGSLLAEAAGSAEPWRDDPVRLGSDRWLGMLDGRRPPQVADTKLGRIEAVYKGPVSNAGALPDLVATDGAAVAIVDGDTVARFDPLTGKKLWSRRAGVTALSEPRRAACVDSERLYVAAGGILRCFALGDGQLVWEQYLGPAGSWRVERTGPWLAASPASASGEVSILLCDPATGEFIERLTTDGPAESVRLHAGADQALLVTDQRLIGYRPLRSGTD